MTLQELINHLQQIIIDDPDKSEYEVTYHDQYDNFHITGKYCYDTVDEIHIEADRKRIHFV